MKKLTFLTMTALLLALLGFTASAQKFPEGSKYFNATAPEVVAKPDNNGFIRNWLLMDPIEKPNRSNTVFTDSYLREAFAVEYYKDQFTELPKDGQKIKIEKNKLQWHALESKNFNVKLFRFASEQELTMYGVIFFGYAVIDCPEDFVNVRLSAGSNSASMWWIDGEEVLIMSGDRRMVVDDCSSDIMTLPKGKHIIRVAVINGPGMSDFCVRFVDEQFNPVKNFTVSYK